MLESVYEFVKENNKPIILKNWNTVDDLISNLKEIFGKNTEEFNPFVGDLNDDNEVKLLDGNYLYNFRGYGLQIGGANVKGCLASIYIII